MSASGTIHKLDAIRRFLLAGNAKFTFVSKRTGKRYTFRSRRPPDPIDPGNSPFFIDLLIGPDNGHDYKYLAFMRCSKAYDRATGFTSEDTVLRLTPNRANFGVEAFESLAWLIRQINAWEAAPEEGPAGYPRKEIQNRFSVLAEFWHSGRCSKCGRELTDPVSIENGLGPVCGSRTMKASEEFQGEYDSDNLRPGDDFGDQS